MKEAGARRWNEGVHDDWRQGEGAGREAAP